MSPFPGQVSDVIVTESSFVDSGDPLIELVRHRTGKSQNSEVVFFIEEQDVLKIKKGMQAVIKINKEEVPQEFLEGTVLFVSDYPVPVASIQKLFGDTKGLLPLISLRVERNVTDTRNRIVIDVPSRKVV